MGVQSSEEDWVVVKRTKKCPVGLRKEQESENSEIVAEITGKITQLQKNVAKPKIEKPWRKVWRFLESFTKLGKIL